MSRLVELGHTGPDLLNMHSLAPSGLRELASRNSMVDSHLRILESSINFVPDFLEIAECRDLSLDPSIYTPIRHWQSSADIFGKTWLSAQLETNTWDFMNNASAYPQASIITYLVVLDNPIWAIHSAIFSATFLCGL